MDTQLNKLLNHQNSIKSPKFLIRKRYYKTALKKGWKSMKLSLSPPSLPAKMKIIEVLLLKCILRVKTMDDKLIYIPHEFDEKQNTQLTKLWF